MRVALVQQGVWDMALESMPLAAGYLKAVAMTDDVLSASTDVTIHNFGGGDTVGEMARRIFGGADVPDVMGFSVLGWNYRAFGLLSETFKQVNPRGVVVFGGNHVANQGRRVLRSFPEVDIVVDGEGETVFRELLHALVGERWRHALPTIEGITFRGRNGRAVTTRARERIVELDTIPSPFLTGAIPMVGDDGRFKYDVALMETNRGCPYKCSFCYWGGAIGQKVRSFSRARLRQELEYLARHEVETVVLCDANFGLLPQDLAFVDDLIDVRNRHGYPRFLETSWAKNKSKTFYSIVKVMSDHGLRSSFTLALQTLDDATLSQMHRTNMRLNEWEDLAEWLESEGLDCYAELIWGAPGETVESFLAGYDRLATRVSRIAVYPMLIIPNTRYATEREQHGLVTVRGDHDDFEYVVSHATMTVAENEYVQRFLFWARTVAENMFFRFIFAPLRRLANMSQSEVLLSLARWFEDCDEPAAAPLKASRARIGDPAIVPHVLHYLYSEPAIPHLLRAWWDEAISPLVAADHRALIDDVFEYDSATRPVYAPPGTPHPDLAVVDVGGTPYYVAHHRFAYDVPAIHAALKRDAEHIDVRPQPYEVTLYYKVGFHEQLDNHEMTRQYLGIPEPDVYREARAHLRDRDVVTL
jgi:tRNA A37 methylthiotransferase MiaB